MQAEPTLEAVYADGHEMVVFAQDTSSNLEAIIAVHSTIRGPALGGTRMLPYQSVAAALQDVLRLSEGMSLKAAAAGLALGGGKGVIIADPSTDKSPELLAAYGRAVDRLGGTYITAEDVGTEMEDLLQVATTTRWVTGLPQEMGGSGDPSPMTARGVVAAMEGVADHLWGSVDLTGRTVAIQGVGKVGAGLAVLLRERGCDLVVADTNASATAGIADQTGARVVDHGQILSQECDVLAPCALGGVLDRNSIPTLRCAAVVGSANNQLATPGDADRLAERGILYAPDYVANAGGIINISVELGPAGYDQGIATTLVDSIRVTVSDILDSAAQAGVTPAVMAASIARARLDGSGSASPPSSSHLQTGAHSP